MHGAESLSGFGLGSSLLFYGAKGEVSCSSAESPGVSLVLTSWGQMKAGSDLHLSLLLGVDSSELGSTELFLGGKDVEGECEGDLSE